MAPKLYGTIFSPAVRSTLLCLKTIDVEFEMKEVNLSVGEHLTPDYLKVIYFYLAFDLYPDNIFI